MISLDEASSVSNKVLLCKFAIVTQTTVFFPNTKLMLLDWLKTTICNISFIDTCIHVCPPPPYRIPLRWNFPHFPPKMTFEIELRSQILNDTLSCWNSFDQMANSMLKKFMIKLINFTVKILRLKDKLYCWKWDWLINYAAESQDRLKNFTFEATEF
jgi:hypothetical protein